MTVIPSSYGSKHLLKSIISVLTIFILWSFLAIYSASVQPLSIENPVSVFLGQSENLAISILAEIIASYFSPFTILHMAQLFFIIGISSKIRMSISRNINKKSESNIISFRSTGKNSEILKLNDLRTQNNPDDPLSITPLTGPATLEIPTHMAVYLERMNGKKQVITKNSEYPYNLSIDNGETVLGIIPLKKKKIHLSYEVSQTSREPGLDDMVLRYGFREKEANNQLLIDPKAILAVANNSDYATWKHLMELCILSGLNNSGIRIKEFLFGDESHFLLDNPKLDQSSMNHIPNKKYKRIPAHKKIYSISGVRYLLSAQPFIHRSRKFSRSIPFIQLADHPKDIQTQDGDHYHQKCILLEKNITDYVNNYLLRIYNYPVAAIVITAS